MKFKELLEEKGISYRELSKVADIPLMTLYDLVKEKSSFNNIKVETAIKIAKTLGMSIEEMYELTRRGE